MWPELSMKRYQDGGGLCNKNLGNAFLMVWRIGDEVALQENSGRRRRRSSLKRSGHLDHSRTVGRSVSTVDLRRIPGMFFQFFK